MTEPVPDKPATSLFSRRRLRLLYLTVITIAVLALAYRLRDAVNPFLLSVLIAYMLNPAVQFFERRLRLPRTAAILLIYAAGISALTAGSVYSVGKTLGGIEKIMTRVAGGWQIAPRTPSGETAEAGAPPATPPATLPRISGLPVYGDDDVAAVPGTSLGFIDVNGNGQREATEPAFVRENGRWRPSPEFAPIVRRVPGYLDEIRSRLERDVPQIERRQIETLAERAQTAAGAVASAGGTLWNWASQKLFGGLASLALYMILVPIYTFFLLRGFDAIVGRVQSLLPGLHRARVESICRRIDRACAAFFRGRFLICIGKGAVTALGLWLVGVDFSLTIGVVAGVFSIVPGVGPLLGFPLAILCAYGPDGAWTTRIIGAGVTFAAAEILEGIANPVVLGREVGLHPVTLLVALFTFGELFGFFGVLLAVPLAAIAKILGQEFILPELQHLAAERPGGGELSGIFHLGQSGALPAAPAREPAGESG